MRILNIVIYSLMIFILPSFSQILSQTKDSLENEIPIIKPDTLQYETDEVVVTATRVQKKIIDIPYPVVRLKNTQYKYDRKVSISDVMGTVPGLFMQSRYGNHDVRISIRGFGSRSNTGIRGVRILLDGIPESEPDGQTRIEAVDFNSLGSIEVVKGNSSSLYTNAPRGVVNFISDINFPSTFMVNYNEIGDFGLRRNGVKVGIRTNNLGFIASYTYHNYKGYRDHSEDFWHIFNSFLETKPGEHSNLQTMFYFADGLIRLPGSQTREEYEMNPRAAAERESDFDFKRISKKGRLGLRYTTAFGETYNNELEVTSYGTIKYFERAQRDFRVMNRYGLGASARWVNKSIFFGFDNEFSLGGDVFYQTGPIETYVNIGGQRSDNLVGLTDETIGNTGIFFQNSTGLIRNKLSLLITGRFDKVVFDQKNQINQFQNDVRRFEDFTPKAALNYKLTPYVAIYTSYGLSFDSPAGNELDNFPTSSSPGTMLNPDLKPQESKNFEIGIKGNLVSESQFFRNIVFELTFFNSIINNEIVPFEVFGDVFFRNSAKTIRRGLEAGFDADIIGGLNLKTAYTYSGFKYDKYLLESVEIDSIGNTFSTFRDFSGNVVPSVPEHNLVVSLSYTHKIVDFITGFTKVTGVSVSEMYVDDANSDKTLSYSLLNFTLGLDMVFNRFNLLISGGMNNITDEKYVSFININSTSGRFFEAGEPRTYFASMNFGYNF
ncbi:MAG: TonB-dependent receptor [Ignavibacteria bacterium]|nr:TonB-dependent receptor [Ignavibacteria bacterium]